MRGSGSTAGASAYGTTSQTPRTSSRPPAPRASPSNVIDVDAINDNDGAKAPATSTSARCCRSVASAPTRPSRPLDPFEAPNYSLSAYAGSAKGKGGPSSKGGKGGVSSHEEFAGIVTRSRRGPATGRCGGHAQVSRQAKHYAHRGINALMSCDKAFQDPCHSATRERKYVQQHIRICTHGVKTGLG